MPYIDRNQAGNIVGVFAVKQYDGQEFVEGAELYAPPPPPIAQIRAIENTPAVADAMKRAARLVALSYAIDDLVRIAASKGQTVTRDQAHAWAMVNDSNYRTLYDAEQAIKPLRALV